MKVSWISDAFCMFKSMSWWWHIEQWHSNMHGYWYVHTTKYKAEKYCQLICSLSHSMYVFHSWSECRIGQSVLFICFHCTSLCPRLLRHNGYFIQNIGQYSGQHIALLLYLQILLDIGDITLMQKQQLLQLQINSTFWNHCANTK